MTQSLIAAVQDWPVLIQGAIGSAIFWLVLLVGQKLTAFSSMKMREHSKERQKIFLFNEILRHKAIRDGGAFEAGAFYAAVLWFRASRHVISGLIWLTLGLIFNAVSDVFGLVGFLGCLYFMFSALAIVKPLDFEGDISEKIAELETKRKELDGN